MALGIADIIFNYHFRQGFNIQLITGFGNVHYLPTFINQVNGVFIHVVRLIQKWNLRTQNKMLLLGKGCVFP